MEEDKIRWSVIDPLGNEIILKESTFQEHIRKDHKFSDAEYRQKAESKAKECIENPQLIIKNEDKLNRHVYYKIVNIPCDDFRESLKIMKIIVDTDRNPNQIVTWILQSKLKDIIGEGWIKYAS